MLKIDEKNTDKSNLPIGYPSDFETLKFLMECSFKEAALFWQRNSVMLAVNLASFGAAFSYLSSTSKPFDLTERVLICLFGMALSTVWMLLTAAGRKMNHDWVDQAREVADKLDQNQIKQALIETPSDSIDPSFNFPKPNSFSATKLMYFLAGVFTLGWLILTLTIPHGLFWY